MPSPGRTAIFIRSSSEEISKRAAIDPLESLDQDGARRHTIAARISKQVLCQ
jgi:hypothetical protein